MVTDGMGMRGANTRPAASNLLEHLYLTGMKNIWKVKDSCVCLVGEQKIGKANMHITPIPTVELLLPIYVISCTYFKIGRRTEDAMSTKIGPLKKIAASTFSSF